MDQLPYVAQVDKQTRWKADRTLCILHNVRYGARPYVMYFTQRTPAVRYAFYVTYATPDRTLCILHNVRGGHLSLTKN